MTSQNIFMIADTHFGDDAIIRYEDRPFESAAAAREEMIRRWNETVAEDDIVYHLGDFADLPDEDCADILQRLNGRKRLIMGNHDASRSPALWRALGFDECYDLPVIFSDWYILSHEPLYISRSMPYANIFGHIHSMPLYKTIGPQSACVSVERTDYRPVLFDDLRQKILAEAKRAGGPTYPA